MGILYLWWIITTTMGLCWYLNNLVESYVTNDAPFKHVHVEIWNFLEYQNINTTGKVIAEVITTIIFLPVITAAYIIYGACIVSKYIWQWFKKVFSKKDVDND